MKVKVTRCPVCGAPVHVSPTDCNVVCLYCETSMRILRDEGGNESASDDGVLGKVEVHRIKELLLTGKREEALAVYVGATGRSAAEAEVAISTYATQVVSATALKGTMSLFGWGLFAVSLLLMAVGVWLFLSKNGFAFAPFTFGALLFWLLLKPSLRTIRYLFSTVGEATIKRHAYIGVHNSIHQYVLYLQVAQPDGTFFETEIAFPVRESGRHKIAEGYQMQVKYFPGKPDSVLFHSN